MKPTDVTPLPVTPLPNGTPIVDPDTQETWVVAYCEAVARNDPFGPYAYGLVNDERDERVVFHTRLSFGQTPATLIPRLLPLSAA